jgi:hypothetical protein
MSDANQFFQPVRGEGVYEAGINDYPNSSALIAHDPSATPSGTDAVKRVTAVTGDANRTGLHAAMLDEAGNPYTESNPLPVNNVGPEGVEGYFEHDTGDLAKNGTGTQTFSPTGTFKVTSVQVAAGTNAKAAVTLKGAAAGRLFVAPAAPNASIKYDPPVELLSGQTAVVLKTNTDNNAQSVYSLITGYYVV